MVEATRGCADPIHLVGGATIIDPATGELLNHYSTDEEPNHRLLVACRNRRASRCPACAELYRSDTYQLIRAGLVGGKGVPESVSAHPKVFATLTAPSFGAVHHRVLNPDGSIKPCHPQAGCGLQHEAHDRCLGQALDADRYDYRGAVIWNALAGQLWHRTTTLIVRRLARAIGLTEKEFRQVVRVSFGKVAEFQARGVVHFHVIVRLDGPDGPADAPPEGLTVDLLAAGIRRAVAQAAVTSPPSTHAGGGRRVCWGDQLDIQIITADEDPGGDLTDQKVAGYVAKYAIKAAENTGTLDRPVACWLCKGRGDDPKDPGRCRMCSGRGTRHDDVHHLVRNLHTQAMISTCWALGACPELEELRLRPWAHMLGFRGHFSTKSRRYSTTLSILRSARQQWRDVRSLASLGVAESRVISRQSRHDPVDEDTILVLGHWQYVGRGHSPGEAAYARTISHDLVEVRRIAWQQSEHGHVAA
jgi:hypothetical protein